MTDTGSQRSASLRRRAEALAARMPEHPTQGVPAAVAGLIRELTIQQIQLELQSEEMERTSRQIEKARDAYARLYDEAPVGFLTLDEAGVIRQSNQTFARMAGSGDPQGMLLRDLVTESDRATLVERYQAFFRFPGGKTMDLHLKKPGGVMAVRLIGRAEPDAAANASGQAPRMRLLVAVLDITEQRQAEQDLRASETRWQFALEGAGGGVWDWNVASGEVFLSERCRRMLGYEAATDYNFEQWVNELHPDDRDRCLDELNRHIEGEVSVYESSHRVRQRDGQYIWVLVRAKTMERDQEGRPLRVIGTQTDITARRQSEEQLAQRQKMESIGSLAAGIAHDFNNLLTVINGYSSLLLGRLNVADPARATVEQIRDAGERAAGLTRRLLVFSRQQTNEPTLVSLDEVLRNMAALLPRLVGEDVKISLQLAARDVSVLIDRHQVEQMVMNLAANARDAMPVGGQLTIETSVTGPPEEGGAQEVVLAVRDTGVGMNDNVRRRAMEPFFTTKGPGKGTGLGLSIIHGIVTHAGGHVDIESELGSGTCFRIHLPVAGHTLVAAPPRPVSQHRAEGTILVVEDATEVAECVAAALRAAGYNVLVADRAGQALDICNGDTAIDLVVSDVVMPEMDGQELAERLRLLRPEADILFMSGYTGEIVAGRGVGQDHAFVQKPFTLDELTTRVAQMFARRNAPPNAQPAPESLVP